LNGNKLGGIEVKRTKLLTISLLICALFTITSRHKVSAQARQPESHKWDYCALTDSFGTGTKEKPFGIAVITFFEEAGDREEYVRVDLDPPKGLEAGQLFETAQKKAFAKAFARLGNDEWEMVGSSPFMKLSSPTNSTDAVVIYFKRPKRQ
jgi:hypothetical protein